MSSATINHNPYERQVYRGHYFYEKPITEGVSLRTSVMAANGKTMLIGWSYRTDGGRGDKLLILIKAEKR